MELLFHSEKAISVFGRTYLWARKCLHHSEDGQHIGVTSGEERKQPLLKHDLVTSYIQA